MRDAFHMYYMDIEGNTVERMTEDELAAVHKKILGLLIPGGLPMQEKKERQIENRRPRAGHLRGGAHRARRRGGVILSRRYVRLGQQFIPVNAAMLDLRGVGLTDLAPLDRCTALTELDVRENKLSAEALGRIPRQAPRLPCALFRVSQRRAARERHGVAHAEDLPNDWENLRLFLKTSARSP